MTDQCECSMKLEFEHLKNDILEIKNTIKEDAKKVTKEMMGMRDSKIRTEIKLETIIKIQEATILSQSKIMEAVQGIKDEPQKAWKKMSWLWKAALVGAVINYIITNTLGYIKLFD